MSLGAGMPRIPGGGRTPRMPRVRDPRMAARSKVSRNPLVKGWRRLRSNRFAREVLPDGRSKGGKGGADAPPVATSAVPAPLDRSRPAVDVPSDPGTAPLARDRAPHHRPGPDATRAERRRARRAARRSIPRGSRRQRRDVEGVLWRSLLEVGRAQWGDDFDPRGLDGRFISAFDMQTRVLVTVPRPGAGTRRVVGHVEVEGFSPEGDAVLSIDPSEGRLAVRPEFRIRSRSMPEPVPVTPEMAIVGIEAPNGRFRLLAESRGGPAGVGSPAVRVEHQA